MSSSIVINDRFRLAADFIQYSNMPVFLTGKAGTGKTTFLKYIREHCGKKMVVVAPTGVAAINAGGTTIHSFFQLPFSPFLPGGAGKHELLGRLRFTTERRKIFQEMELLIIDEISMVRSDVLDSIDTMLRHLRNQVRRPFGGVQVLYIGDLFQLSPVIKNEEWELLSSFYKSAYFFDSHVIMEQTPVYIELDKIYRQSEGHFIELLNRIRNNNMDDASRRLLDSRYSSAANTIDHVESITLTTHNHTADEINRNELDKLTTDKRVFKATIEGEFSEKAYPADTELILKTGAKVMFLKNDSEKVRRYFNGKIGTVERFEEDKIIVRCDGDDAVIEVKKETWNNIRYVHDKKSNKIEEEQIGAFIQYPLRLAWAITIHKSQGLTFEKTVIDAGAAFAPGQVYVALSRCTKLEGIVLKSRINDQSLKTDRRIIDFVNGQLAADALPAHLELSKAAYQRDLIRNLFDMSEVTTAVSSLHNWFNQHKKYFNTETGPWVNDISDRLVALDNISVKFGSILNNYFTDEPDPAKNPELLKRLAAAADHYKGHLDFVIRQMNQSPASTDSIIMAREFMENTAPIFEAIHKRTHLLGCCVNGFSAHEYARSVEAYRPANMHNNVYAGKSNKQSGSSSRNPELYSILKDIRDHICQAKDLPVYMVCASAGLTEMADFLPCTKEELMQITGFGKAKAEQWGDDFLDPIREYCREHNLETRISEKPGKKKAVQKIKADKTDTRIETLNLFRLGQSIEEIAVSRNLTTGTIKKHLLGFISNGDVALSAVITGERESTIRQVLYDHPGESLNSIMGNLPVGYEYDDVRMVMAAMEREKAVS